MLRMKYVIINKINFSKIHAKRFPPSCNRNGFTVMSLFVSVENIQ